MPQQRRSFKLAERFFDLWLRGGSVPKHVRLISLLVVCSLWSVPRSAHAQALIPHTLQLDAAKLEKQGLSLAQEAAQLAQFQQVELALPRARLATQLAPKNDKVWLLLGGLQLQTKEFDGAIAALKKAQSLNPKNADILFALGSVNFQQKNYQAAVENYQAGLKLKPNDSEGLFDLGNAYYLLGRLPDAIAQYNKAVSQDKKFWPALNNIGLINYEQGDTQGAIKQWQTAVTLDKQAAEPLLALAVALYTKGDASGEQGLRQQGLTLGEAALRIDQRYANLDFLKENLWGQRLLSDTKKFLELPRIQAALQQRENSSSPRLQPTQ
ncbi:tetratricopeptide repeat protein [aff. Roholtiella sp. LEGE 12411]|nr:tetratricopeptide repeat protein [aff. Roholtiella sp. LEGE 12411]MBE9036318.1 tetratricopeptide repeat protein [aff. Roholtiella sp. LEGE 12411]